MKTDLVVIMTALALEYDAVRAQLREVSAHRHRQHTLFEVGDLPEGGRAAIVNGGKGNHPTAVIAERAIAEFSPVSALFVGVAGALRARVAVGDVVVATHVYAFHGGASEETGFKLRPRVWETSHRVDQMARHVARNGPWLEGAEPTDGETSKILFGPIAAGEVLLNATDSDVARLLRGGYSDALAIDMESAGLAQAAHLNEALPTATIRGISDRADGNKEASDRAGAQPKAAARAAAFALRLASELLLHSAPTVSETRPKPGVTPANPPNWAINSNVGVQANVVHGGISFGSGPGDSMSGGTQ